VLTKIKVTYCSFIIIRLETKCEQGCHKCYHHDRVYFLRCVNKKLNLPFITFIVTKTWDAKDINNHENFNYSNIRFITEVKTYISHNNKNWVTLEIFNVGFVYLVSTMISIMVSKIGQPSARLCDILVLISILPWY
jgi:hypothetical protein